MSTMPMSAPQEAAPAKKSSTCPTILIVDDNPVDRRLAEGILERRLHCRTVRAGDGAEALRLIQADAPDLVLTDLLMPEMDGLQLVEAVRSQHPQVPVILMTAHGSEDIALQALRAGAASYVPKKRLSVELSETVEQVLAAAKAGSEKGRLLGCVTRMEAEFLLDNDPQLARALVAHLQEHLMRLGIDDRTRTRVGIALEEALLNGIYHGNLGVHSELKQQSGRAFERLADERRTLPPYCERRLHVRADLSGMAVHFVVRDEGPGFDVAALADPTDPANLDKPSGRGCC